MTRGGEVEDIVDAPRLLHPCAERLLARLGPFAMNAGADEAVGLEVLTVQETEQHALRGLARIMLHSIEVRRQALRVHIAPHDRQTDPCDLRDQTMPNRESAFGDDADCVPVGAGLDQAAVQLGSLQRTDIPARLAGKAEDSGHPVTDGAKSSLVEIDDGQRRTSYVPAW